MTPDHPSGVIHYGRHGGRNRPWAVTCHWAECNIVERYSLPVLTASVVREVSLLTACTWCRPPLDAIRLVAESDHAW